MTPGASRSPLVERSKREVVLRAQQMIERSVQGAASGLEEAQRTSRSVARRMQLGDAHATLARYAPTLRTEFPRLLMEGVEEALRHQPADAAPRPASSEASILALLDEVEVSRFVEASRLQQDAMPVVERVLGTLDSLMSSALGLPVVRADLNPFRPEILCTALLKVLQSLPESDDIRSLWIRHLSGPFSIELRGLYEGLVEMLQGQGVEEARYRVKLSTGGGVAGGGGGGTGQAVPGDVAGSEGGTGGGSGSGGGARGSADAPGVAGHPGLRASAQNQAVGPAASGAARVFVPRVNELSRSAPAIGAAVVHDFLYQPQWIEQYDEPLPAGYYEEVQSELSRLSGQVELAYDHPDLVRERESRRSQDVMERAARVVRADTALAPDEWGEFASARARARALMELKARAAKISQVLGLDAVRLLINQVAGDERVLAPVREAFVALEPALLRLALDHPRFFAEENHPARALMEAVAQRSFKYNDEFAPEFEEFMGPVRDAVRALTAAPVVTPGDFEARHRALEESWKAQDESEQASREQALHSMQFAQERQALADRIAWEFSLRPDLVGVPAVVADFLYRDWSLVIAHAQLTSSGGGLDPGGYLAVVTDLLWSVNREQAMRQPVRLFEVVPGVLATLRRGLEMLGKEPAETQAFFDALLRYHEPVLRLRRMRSVRDAEASGLMRLGSEFGALPPESGGAPLERPAAPRKAEQPWLGRREREAAGFADTEALAESTSSAAAPEPGAPMPLSQDVPSGPPLPAADTAAAAQPDGTQVLESISEDELEARVRAEVARLRPGHWVDLYVHKAWRRAQLSWTSDNGSLFMFVSQGGGAHGMTRRTCEKLMHQRHLRPVDIDPVIDRALRRLSQDAAAQRQSEEPLPATG